MHCNQSVEKSAAMFVPNLGKDNEILSLGSVHIGSDEFGVAFKFTLHSQGTRETGQFQHS
jgi:hypothetical protein